jgi:hypothetical protein
VAERQLGHCHHDFDDNHDRAEDDHDETQADDHGREHHNLNRPVGYGNVNFRNHIVDRIWHHDVSPIVSWPGLQSITETEKRKRVAAHSDRHPFIGVLS